MPLTGKQVQHMAYCPGAADVTAKREIENFIPHALRHNPAAAAPQIQSAIPSQPPPNALINRMLAARRRFRRSSAVRSLLNAVVCTVITFR